MSHGHVQLSPVESLVGERGQGEENSGDPRAAMLKPVRRRSLADAVFEQLRDAIITGEFAPGSRLPAERVLSEMLAVNRGAVREALKRLGQKGLVSIQHGGATRVLDFTATAQLDLLVQLLAPGSSELDLKMTRSFFELESAVLSELARLAAQRGGSKLADRLTPVLAEMRAAQSDLPQLQTLNDTFWQILVGASDNLAFQLVLNTLHAIHLRHREPLRPYVAQQYKDASGLASIGRAVVDADSGQAADAVREHVAPTLRAISEARVSEDRSEDRV